MACHSAQPVTTATPFPSWPNKMIFNGNFLRAFSIQFVDLNIQEARITEDTAIKGFFFIACFTDMLCSLSAIRDPSSNEYPGTQKEEKMKYICMFLKMLCFFWYTVMAEFRPS